MSPLFDCRDEAQLLPGMRQARQAIGRGDLVVMPTDTVYGVAADAFSPAAVQRLLDAKGRGRQSPPPVLVAGVTTLRALVAEVPEPVERLVEQFWPGGLTIVLPAMSTLSWDLGDTQGTVAVRMPAHRIALELLEETGPLAVSSANLTGKSPGVTAAESQTMLGDSVAVYLEAGPCETGVSSTIIDATGLATGGSGTARILREGAVDRESLGRVLGDLLEPEATEDADDATVEEPAAGATADAVADTAVGESAAPAVPDTGDATTEEGSATEDDAAAQSPSPSAGA